MLNAYIQFAHILGETEGFDHVLYRFLINTLLIIYSLAEATEVATTGKTH